jgi:hypothetical protein
MISTIRGHDGEDDTQRSLDDLTTAPQAAVNDADLPREADAAATGHEHWLTPAADEKALRTQLLVRTLRHQIARVVTERRIAEARRGTEETALTPEEIERQTNILLGDGFLKEGQLDRVRKAYAEAGAEIPNENRGDQQAGDQIRNDTRSEIDRTIPGILKRD